MEMTPETLRRIGELVDTSIQTLRGRVDSALAHKMSKGALVAWLLENYATNGDRLVPLKDACPNCGQRNPRFLVRRRMNEYDCGIVCNCGCEYDPRAYVIRDNSFSPRI